MAGITTIGSRAWTKKARRLIQRTKGFSTNCTSKHHNSLNQITSLYIGQQLLPSLIRESVSVIWSFFGRVCFKLLFNSSNPFQWDYPFNFRLRNVVVMSVSTSEGCLMLHFWHSIIWQRDWEVGQMDEILVVRFLSQQKYILKWWNKFLLVAFNPKQNKKSHLWIDVSLKTSKYWPY